MASTLPDIDAVLRGALAWPVANVAFAVLDPDGDEHFSGSTDHQFGLASVTKLLSALAVLIACEEEVCSLDDPVDAVAGATLGDLLCHASGVGPEPKSPSVPPRTRRAYSNYGYLLAAEHVAAASEIEFATYVHEAVCDPLGLRATRLIGHPGSGAVSNARDLMLVLRELAAPTLIAPETASVMTGVQLPELDGILPGYGAQIPNPWGMGPEIRGEKRPHWSSRRNSPETYGHFGRSGSILWFDPVARVGLVALADREFGGWAVEAWPVLAEQLLDQFGVPPAEPSF